MKMNVYTYFDETEHAPVNQTEMLRIWVRSWKARGWRPRILTIRNAAKHPDFVRLKDHWHELPRLAQESAKATHFFEASVINFSFRPKRVRAVKEFHVKRYLSDGWEQSALVEFENCHDVSLIEHCGRPL